MSPLLAINELVPGDSGGKIAFRFEVKILCGTTGGSGGEIVDR